MIAKREGWRLLLQQRMWQEHVTQEVLSMETGKHRSHISNILTGERNPDPVLFSAMCRSLRMTPEEERDLALVYLREKGWNI